MERDLITTSKNRSRLLVNFFINAAHRGQMWGLVEEFNESTNAIRKHWNNLSEAAYLEKKTDGISVFYRAKRPLFRFLQDIIHRHLGLDAIVAEVLDCMCAFRQVVVIGDYVEGGCGTIMGPSLNTAYLSQLVPKVKNVIHYEVRFTLSDRKLNTGLILFEQTE